LGRYWAMVVFSGFSLGKMKLLGRALGCWLGLLLGRSYVLGSILGCFLLRSSCGCSRAELECWAKFWVATNLARKYWLYLRPQILFRPRSSQSPWPDPIPTPWPQRCPSLCSSLWPSCSHWLIPTCWRKLDSVTPFHSLRSLLPYQPSQSLGPTISWSQSHCSTHYTPILPSPLSWIPPPPP
jgi:hypothetical protein